MSQFLGGSAVVMSGVMHFMLTVSRIVYDGLFRYNVSINK